MCDSSHWRRFAAPGPEVLPRLPDLGAGARLLVIALSVVLVQTLSTAAQAAITVSIDPNHVTQCSPAHFSASMGNASSSPLPVDVTVTLLNGKSSLFENVSADQYFDCNLAQHRIQAVRAR